MGSAAKREYLKEITARYRRAGKRDKRLILNEFRRVCGYHRKHAIRLLSRQLRRPRGWPGPASQYSPAKLREALARLRRLTDYPCSKRLKGLLDLRRVPAGDPQLERPVIFAKLPAASSVPA